ncbi:IS5/IS1182 family transposase [Streptomyces sp. NBC_01017]|uniref:transposase family protein n=1 Tax=Streptomyces sp. NBC_01017 TaxID=2903721 RepID=UPI003865907F|nr:IS5/IS1182 family transposase [Streptomyces sp. NBC_01017]WSV35957.1 IS5/IS1182 family transposase [Streptomyces sp. NBC_01017]
MVSYAAMLDVPRHVVEFLARLPAGHRRRIGTPKSSRALGPFRQAVLVLRWFREGSCVHCLARDAGISQATGYRYLHEGVDVLAGQAPDLHRVLAECRQQGMNHLILDGTLIESDRVAGVHLNAAGKEVDTWYSAKHKAFGANVQFVSAPDGTPLWVSDGEPGSVPDITAARSHCLPALYKAAADGLPTLADAGYQGAGIGIHHPFKKPRGSSHLRIHPDTRTRNALLRSVRALGERAAAELKERWRTLKRITLSPGRIGAIAKAALVLNNAWR